MSLYSLTLGIVLTVVMPILIWTRFKRDVFILLYGFFGLFALNTSLMAVIRDCGGMEFLSELGLHPWFALQYDVAYYTSLISRTCLVIFFIRLVWKETSPAAR